MEFRIGQRWISQTEAALGLGLITGVSGRLVSVQFPAVDEERTYATDNAPLARLAFQPGDPFEDDQGETLTVIRVHEQQGLLVYEAETPDGDVRQVPEVRVTPHVRLSGARQRLFCGQTDRMRAFRLRRDALHHLGEHASSPARGLIGARIRHLPHQVHVASEVARRPQPRVLLADEVGLGKTIEAGLILHHRVQTGQAHRLLVVVPEPLVHQWLVEMLRRFNLHFAVFDGGRFEALTEEAPDQNPFDSHQQILCSLEWLSSQPEAMEQALATNWDMLVVDEAHHLHWSPQHSSPEYDTVAALAQQIPGVLLLTATPEQAGPESHFARLRLLDPDRFADPEQFREEAEQYPRLNALVQALADGTPRSDLTTELSHWLGADESRWPSSTDELIEHLSDCHGTGRVLFRNTRDAVGGFPERQLHISPLTTPANTTDFLPEGDTPDDQWLQDDPRVEWLKQLLRQHRPEKMLVICARADTARTLEHHLQLYAGIRSAAFHEGLTLMERDRAAAWFADEEQGAQALICSEIGSEGRNFQFARHLVLFDLPASPDLLEQRIGRLDRIGQGDTIHIHVPELPGTPQGSLLRWYHQGLDALQRSCAVGTAVQANVQARLNAQLADPTRDDADLIKETRAQREQLEQALESGRDALIERHSCHPERAQTQIETIEAAEADASLPGFFTELCDLFGLDHEPLGEHGLILRPSDHMRIDHMPHLPEDGLSLTFDREVALAREDLIFASWEHPLVQDAMALLLDGDLGNVAAGTLKLPGVAEGTLLLEALLIPHCPAPRALDVTRYLPTEPVRVMVDGNGRDLSGVIGHGRLDELLEGLKRRTAQSLLPQLRSQTSPLLERAQAHADGQLDELREAAQQQADRSLTPEITRLEALRERNPSVRQAEIDALIGQKEATQQALARTTLEVDALRLVITT